MTWAMSPTAYEPAEMLQMEKLNIKMSHLLQLIPGIPYYLLSIVGLIVCFVFVFLIEY